MYTFQPTSSGTVQVYQDGKLISTATPDLAKTQYGYTGQTTPALSGTQDNPQLPQNSGTSEPNLPQTSGSGNALLDFSNTLNQAVDLARQKRNSLALKFMQPLQGTVSAGDFNSILGNLNSASDKTASTLIDTASKANTPTYKTETIGGDLYQVQTDANGQIIGKPTLILKNPNPSSTSDSKAMNNDVAAAIMDFQNQIRDKGWAGANPQAYQYYRSQLTNLYGASAALALDKAMQDAGIIVDTTNQ